MSPSPFQRLYHRTLLRKWKTLDWAKNTLCHKENWRLSMIRIFCKQRIICARRKTKDYQRSESSASDTSKFVQWTHSLHLWASGELWTLPAFEYHMKPKYQTSCLSWTYFTSRHLFFFPAKTTNLRGPLWSKVLLITNHNCMNQWASTVTVHGMINV